jgi:hypothetical protein
MMISQCSCCGNNFSISSKEQVLFCSKKCEKDHDLFKNQKSTNKKIAKRSNAWQKPINNTLIIT